MTELVPGHAGRTNPRDWHGRWMRADAEGDVEVEMWPTYGPATDIHEEIWEAEVLTDSSKSTEVALRDPFKEWEIRLAQLRQAEELGALYAWEGKTIDLLRSFAIVHRVSTEDVARLIDHVSDLEKVGTWGDPTGQVTQISFEIGWDLRRGFPRYNVEDVLEELVAR